MIGLIGLISKLTSISTTMKSAKMFKALMKVNSILNLSPKAMNQMKSIMANPKKKLLKREMAIMKKHLGAFEKSLARAMKMGLGDVIEELMSETVTEATGQPAEFVLQRGLSSSWLTYGIYQPVGDSAGNLVLSMRGGTSGIRTYTFPSVPKDTWVNMLAATGSHGTGAGSVFWHEYWHRARKSKGYEKFRQKSILAGIASPKNSRDLWR